MRYWGMDYIKCIHCGSFPLKMIPLETREENVDTSGLEFPLCRSYCAYLNENIIQGKTYPCDKCLTIAIVNGVLYCDKCGRWYPIINGILHILKDSKRKEDADKEFLRRWRDKLPEEIVIRGKPFNLENE